MCNQFAVSKSIIAVQQYLWCLRIKDFPPFYGRHSFSSYFLCYKSEVTASGLGTFTGQREEFFPKISISGQGAQWTQATPPAGCFQPMSECGRGAGWSGSWETRVSCEGLSFALAGGLHSGFAKLLWTAQGCRGCTTHPSSLPCLILGSDWRHSLTPQLFLLPYHVFLKGLPNKIQACLILSWCCC